MEREGRRRYIPHESEAEPPEQRSNGYGSFRSEQKRSFKTDSAAQQQRDNREITPPSNNRSRSEGLRAAAFSKNRYESGQKPAGSLLVRAAP